MSKTAAVWRHDGVIHYCVPAVVAANTFLALAASHTSWLCFVLEDMAQVLDESDLAAAVRQEFHVKFNLLREGMVKGHKVDESNRSLRMFRGTDTTFPGMVYGTMHPTELSALADDLSDMAVAMTVVQQSAAGQQVLDSWNLWLEAAKKYVRPHEQMGPMYPMVVARQNGKVVEQ